MYYLNFLEFCNVLDFEVQEIGDFEELADTHTQKPQKIEKINHSSFSPSLLSTCELEYPEGEVALNSPFYVERPPIEQRCYEQIKKPGFLIRIKAPQQMGKSSLLARILHQSENQGNITVAIDFQLVEEEFFSDLNRFLHWFCDTVTEAVAGDNRELLEKSLQQLDEHWKSVQRFGYMKTCKNYFERYLFREINQPLVLGLETSRDYLNILKYTVIFLVYYALYIKKPNVEISGKNFNWC
nr:AAA-like domain-containing protein [Nostoc sp. CmiSLP01]